MIRKIKSIKMDTLNPDKTTAQPNSGITTTVIEKIEYTNY